MHQAFQKATEGSYAYEGILGLGVGDGGATFRLLYHIVYIHTHFERCRERREERVCVSEI